MTLQQQEQTHPMMATGYPAYPAYPAMMPATSAPMFRRIKVRHTMFKVGVGCLFLSTVLFIIGYSAPAWVYQQGLWLACGWGACGSTVGGGPDWLEAVRAMETLALVCFLFSVAVELYQDVFKSPPPPENKAVEILAGLAGILSLIGLSIYGAKVTVRVYRSDGFGSGYYTRIRRELQWAYGLAAAGCILVLISCFLIAYSRVTHAAQTQQVMAAAGAFAPGPPAPAMMSMQPMMQPMQMPPAGHYPYMPSYPYSYPYPAPTMTPIMPPAPTVMAPTGMAAMPAPPQGTSTPQTVPSAPTMASGEGMPTSQIPAYYVMVQGRMVPVYNEMPPTSATTTTQQTVVPVKDF